MVMVSSSIWTLIASIFPAFLGVVGGVRLPPSTPAGVEWLWGILDPSFMLKLSMSFIVQTFVNIKLCCFQLNRSWRMLSRHLKTMDIRDTKQNDILITTLDKHFSFNIFRFELFFVKV